MTGSGVSLTQGRGKNKAVVLDVSFKELEVWAAKNKANEQKLWERAYNRACKGLRDKFAKVVSSGGGVNGVPKFKDFEDFTRQFRTATNKTTPMGGVLADKKRIVWQKVNRTTYNIGWIDALKDLAIKFQDSAGADGLFTNERSRRWLYGLGIKPVPTTYTHNPRQIIPEPFGSYVKQYLAEWAKGAYYKDLARQMAKKVIVPA